MDRGGAVVAVAGQGHVPFGGAAAGVLRLRGIAEPVGVRVGEPPGAGLLVADTVAIVVFSVAHLPRVRMDRGVGVVAVAVLDRVTIAVHVGGGAGVHAHQRDRQRHEQGDEQRVKGTGPDGR
jgi:hypothetical protein